jgi:predicted RNA-binding Zn ribbon-like protein
MNSETDVPRAARLVRDFVNTHERQVDREDLSSPESLRDWFAEHGLMPDDGELGPSDLTTAVTVREGLRAVLLSHAGHAADPAALVALNETLAKLPVRLSFSDPGYRLVGTSGEPFGQAVGQLADAIRECSEDGTWVRLKACARESCRWAFYDASRNQVRRWCSMAGCGNHVKMQRAYAARKSRERSASAGR